jgi:predicted dehydrogenase
VQVGYPRRFDPAFRAARAAVEAGELGWVHTVRSSTLDPAPAPREYIEVSGGIFRDCSVHDFDTVRWITGREVVEVYATGSAKGADYFAEFGDVATASTLLTFDDGATAVVSNTRYNPRGPRRQAGAAWHQRQRRRWLERHHPPGNLEPGATWPAGPPATFGCYNLHSMRVLAPFAGGEPALVSATGAERHGHPGVDEWVTAELLFPNGVTGTAGCNMASDHHQLSHRLVGSIGEAVITDFVNPHLDDRLVVTTKDGTRTEHLGRRSSYTYQLEAFTTAIRTGVPAPTHAAEAVRTMRLIDSCYEAMGMRPRPTHQRSLPRRWRDGRPDVPQTCGRAARHVLDQRG